MAGEIHENQGRIYKSGIQTHPTVLPIGSSQCLKQQSSSPTTTKIVFIAVKVESRNRPTSVLSAAVHFEKKPHKVNLSVR